MERTIPFTITTTPARRLTDTVPITDTHTTTRTPMAVIPTVMDTALDMALAVDYPECLDRSLAWVAAMVVMADTVATRACIAGTAGWVELETSTDPVADISDWATRIITMGLPIAMAIQTMKAVIRTTMAPIMAMAIRIISPSHQECRITGRPITIHPINLHQKRWHLE